MLVICGWYQPNSLHFHLRSVSTFVDTTVQEFLSISAPEGAKHDKPVRKMHESKIAH
jgi:hypothetical protein